MMKMNRIARRCTPGKENNSPEPCGKQKDREEDPRPVDLFVAADVHNFWILPHR